MVKMKSIAIVSGKRNSGKTVTAINLAVSLSIKGKDIILVDADEQAKINSYLGTRERNTLDQVLKGEKELHEAIYLHPSGIRIIPSVLNDYKKHKHHIAEKIDELKPKTQAIIINAPMENENFDKVIDASDEVIFVAPADIYSIRAISEVVRKVALKNKTMLGVVLTKTGSEDYSEYVHKMTGLPIIGKISDDKKIDQSIRQNIPVVFIKDKCQAAKGYDALASLFI